MIRRMGYICESLIELHLSGKGFKYLGRNIKIAGGEIDLVYFNNNCLHFVEVKSGRVSNFIRSGFKPEDHVTRRKVAVLKRAASLLANGKYSYYARSGWQIDLYVILIPADTEPEVTMDYLHNCVIRHYENI